MPRLLVIDDRDQTVEMVHRQMPQFDTVTRCDRRIPCQVCEERTRGCPLRCAHDFAEAAEALGRLPALPDLVVLDLHFALPEERLLPEDKSELPADPKARRTAVEGLRRRQGLLILERLRATYPTLPVVMLTTTGSDLGADRPEDPLVYLCENEVVDSRSLAAEISRALALSHSAQEGPIFWGRAPGMAELRRQLEMLARSPLPLLLEGETGTGKSFLAEHVIHPRSGAKGPLVVTDLSTMPPALLAAHLFGTRRGAYTGAVEDHAGVFEQAHGGTLFLDEIANLDLDLQRQLLLVLERGTVTRLGDTRARPARPKLVAATHEDVEALVHAGRFRADLFMRLNPATRLRVPPLRERRADLPELVRFAFLEALRSESLRPLVRAYLARFPTPDDFVEANNAIVFGRPRAASARRDAFSLFVSREALARLHAHDWPGNHRELKLLAANALVYGLTQHLDTPRAGLDDAAQPQVSARAPAILDIPDPLIARLLGAVTAKCGRPGAGAARGGTRRVEIELGAAGSFARVSADVERQYLRALYEACGGDLEKMARELLGPRGSARQVHLRLNQLGLRLRDRRGTGPRGAGQPA
jgi:DNA-binding NtrC family response regulator